MRHAHTPWIFNEAERGFSSRREGKKIAQDNVLGKTTTKMDQPRRGGANLNR